MDSFFFDRRQHTNIIMRLDLTFLLLFYLFAKVFHTQNIDLVNKYGIQLFRLPLERRCPDNLRVLLYMARDITGEVLNLLYHTYVTTN